MNASPTGGIDLAKVKMDSRFRGNDSREGGNDSEEIKFHIDPAQLEQLQNAPGFVPEIINIQPLPAGQAGMKDLREFLGFKDSP